MIHRNKLFNKSVKNKDRYIPEGYNQRILDTLDKLPDTLPEEKQDTCIVKHSRTFSYTTAMSAAAVIVLVMGSVYVYTNFASGGKDDDDDPQVTGTTVTTVTTVTTDKSEKDSDYTGSSDKELTATSVSGNTSTLADNTAIKNHDIAGNTDINAAETVRTQSSTKKQTTSVYNKKETQKAVQTTTVKVTTKSESKPVVNETKKTEEKQTAAMPEHTIPDKNKPVVTAPPAVTPPQPVPPVHTNRGNEKQDNDRHENNKDIFPDDKEKEVPYKSNGRMEEEKPDYEENFHAFEDVKEDINDKDTDKYDPWDRSEYK